MSTVKSIFCGLQNSKKSSNKSKTTKPHDNHPPMCDNNYNKRQQRKNTIEDQDDREKIQQISQNKAQNDNISESGTPQNTPFLSRPLKLLSIQFLYKNPIGRQFTRENLKNSDCCRAIKNPDLFINEQQAEYVKSIPNALSWRGLLLQGYLVAAKSLKQIENFPIREDDVWLATYPKSGTTWTEEILSLIVADANIKKTNKTILPERVPHLEVGPPIGYMNWLKKRPSPRLVATHLPIGHIPQQLRQCKAKVRFFLLFLLKRRKRKIQEKMFLVLK